MRMGHLLRAEDPTGISGLGIVAELVEWSDGTAAVRWLPAKAGWPPIAKPTTVIHDDIASVIGLHSHDGKTRIVWADA